MPKGPESGGLRGPFDGLDSGGFPDHVEQKGVSPRRKRGGAGRQSPDEPEGGLEKITKKKGGGRDGDKDTIERAASKGNDKANKKSKGRESAELIQENDLVEEVELSETAKDEARTSRVLEQGYFMLEKLASFVNDSSKKHSQKVAEVARVRREIEKTTFSNLGEETDRQLREAMLNSLEEKIKIPKEENVPQSKDDTDADKPMKSKKSYVWSKNNRDTRDAPSKTDRKNLYKYTGSSGLDKENYDQAVDTTAEEADKIDQPDQDSAASNEGGLEKQNRPDNFSRAMRDIDSLRKLVSDKGSASEIETEFRRIFRKIGDTQFSNKGESDNEELLKESLIEELKSVYESINWDFYKEPEHGSAVAKSKNKRRGLVDETGNEEKYDAQVYGTDNDFFRDYSLNDSDVLLKNSMTKKRSKGVKKASDGAKEEGVQKASTDDAKTPSIKRKSKIFNGKLLVGLDVANPQQYPGFDKVLEDDAFVNFANEYAKANGFDINEHIRKGDEFTIEQIFIKYGKVMVVENEITNAYRELISEKLDFGVMENASKSKEPADKQTLNSEAVENIRLYLEGLALNGGSDRIEEMFQTILDFKKAPGEIKKAENELMEELGKWKDQPGLQDNETVKENLRVKIAERDNNLRIADALDKSVEKRRSLENPIEKVASVFPDIQSIKPETFKLINRLAENEERATYKIDRTNGINQATTGALALWAGMSLKEVDTCIDELVKLGLLEEGKSKDPARDNVEYVRIISKPSEILEKIVEVTKGKWVSKEGKWTEDEAKYAQKLYREQDNEIKHKPYKWHQRVRQVGELLKSGHLSKTEADRGLGLFGRMFGTVGKIKRAAEKIRLEHQAKKEEYENALKKIEEMEKFNKNAKIRYQQLRKKLVSDSTITHLVRYSLTKEIIGQINKNIESTEKASMDGAAIGYLEKSQRKIRTVKKHLETTDNENDFLVDRESVEKVQKEIDDAFKDVLAKKVKEAIEKINSQKEGEVSAHKNFHDLIMRVSNNPLRSDISYGTMEKKEARDFVAKILAEKDDELAQKEVGAQDDKKADLAMKRRSINLIIRDLKQANQNEK
jgi:hypothetical protein